MRKRRTCRIQDRADQVLLDVAQPRPTSIKRLRALGAASAIEHGGGDAMWMYASGHHRGKLSEADCAMAAAPCI